MAVTTLKFVCGAECGIAATGTASAGVEHWSGIVSTPAIVTSGPSPMRSTRCFQFNTGGGNMNLVHTFGSAISAPATSVFRFYIYFSSLPTSNCTLVMAIGSSGNSLGVCFTSSNNTIRGGSAAGAQGASGVVVTTNTWYRIDCKSVFNTTDTVDVQVDGTAAAQYTVAGSSRTSTAIQVGPAAAVTANFYIDDIIVSETSGDYPIGSGTVVGLYPNADIPNANANAGDDGIGHFYSAVTDFGKGSGGGTNLAAQQTESTSWQSLANPLSTSIGTNFIANKTGNTSAPFERLSHAYDDLPADAASVNGCMLVATSHSASATANNFTLLVYTPGGAPGSNSVAINADLSESTITVPIAVFNTDANNGSAPITVAGVNGLFTHFRSTDVNPDVYLDGACFEVDYIQANPRPLWVAKAVPIPRKVRSVRSSAVT